MLKQFYQTQAKLDYQSQSHENTICPSIVFALRVHVHNSVKQLPAQVIVSGDGYTGAPQEPKHHHLPPAIAELSEAIDRQIEIIENRNATLDTDR